MSRTFLLRSHDAVLSSESAPAWSDVAAASMLEAMGARFASIAFTAAPTCPFTVFVTVSAAEEKMLSAMNNSPMRRIGRARARVCSVRDIDSCARAATIVIEGNDHEVHQHVSRRLC